MSEQPKPPPRINLRPREGGLMYSPHRDIAYLYVPAMKEALFAFREENWTDEMRDVMDKLGGITAEAIGNAAVRIANAHQLFVNVESIDSADAALARAGWYEVPMAIRYLIYGRLGEVILGGFFVALRDVSPLGGEPANARQLAELVAAGRQLMERSIVPPDGDQRVDQVLTQAAELETVRAALDRLQAEHEKQLAEIKSRVAADFDDMSRQLNTYREFTRTLRAKSFFQRLCWAFSPAFPGS